MEAARPNASAGFRKPPDAVGAGAASPGSSRGALVARDTGEAREAACDRPGRLGDSPPMTTDTPPGLPFLDLRAGPLRRDGTLEESPPRAEDARCGEDTGEPSSIESPTSSEPLSAADEGTPSTSRPSQGSSLHSQGSSRHGHGEGSSRYGLDRPAPPPSHSTKAASAAGTMVAIVLAGALLVHNLEGWGIVDSLYWSVLTC